MGGLSHTVSGDIASFRTPSRVPIESLKFHFLPKQEGSGDPSPTNIRPITGWTGLNWLMEPDVYYFEQGGIADAYGTDTTASNRIRTRGFIPFDIDTFKIIDGKVDSDECVRAVYYYDMNKTFISSKMPGNNTLPYLYNMITPNGTKYVRIVLWKTDHTSNISPDNKCIIIKSTNSYKIPVTFPDGQTIYGGYIDPVKGKLVATHGIYRTVFGPSNPPGVLGDYERHGYNMNIEFKPAIDLHDNGLGPYNGKTFCNVAFWQWNYFGDSLHYYIDGHQAYIMLPVGTDPDTEIEFCAELATPIEYDIPAQDLKAFLDHNNFWSDANDITEVTYAVTESKDILATRKKAMAFDHAHHKKVKWNQLAPAISSPEWYAHSSDISTAQFDNGVATLTTIGETDQQYRHALVTRHSNNFWVIGHKYYLRQDVLLDQNGYCICVFGNEWGAQRYVSKNVWTTITDAHVTNSTSRNIFGLYPYGSLPIGTVRKVKNIMLFDLTQMFGLGNEPSTVEEFEHICEINGIDLTTYQPYDTGSDRWLIVP